MKKWICALLVCLLALPLAASADTYANRLEKVLGEGKLIMGTAPGFPPYEFMDLAKTGPDAVVGSDIELGKYIAEQLGVELVIETMDFATLLAAVSQGTVDIAISGMAPKEDRAEMMEFSVPFNTDGYQGVIIHSDNADAYQALTDFGGQTIMVQNGSLQQNLVEEQMPDAKIEFVTTVGDGVMMVKTKKAAGVAIAGVVGELYTKSYPELMFIPEHFEYATAGTVVGIVKGETALLEAIDPIVTDAEESGLYAQWRDDALTLAASQMVSE